MSDPVKTGYAELSSDDAFLNTRRTFTARGDQNKNMQKQTSGYGMREDGENTGNGLVSFRKDGENS
jgi:hypothetical protein